MPGLELGSLWIELSLFSTQTWCFDADPRVGGLTQLSLLIPSRSIRDSAHVPGKDRLGWHSPIPKKIGTRILIAPWSQHFVEIEEHRPSCADNFSSAIEEVGWKINFPQFLPQKLITVSSISTLFQDWVHNWSSTQSQTNPTRFLSGSQTCWAISPTACF